MNVINIEQHKTQKLAEEWIKHGESLHHDPEMREKRLPLYPGFVYRKSGDWTGWNAFLGVTDKNSPEFKVNQQTDSLEDAAWEIYQAIMEQPLAN